ncbi:hypothetical protein [Chromatium okenii]|jgi:hypothetical protein|uniref:hypothetical protein n=1 Tax=Chromatium okenii TaxID=61644 RepID=UPI0026F262E4|nr:hypothetical protein [Chromatium okenii]MBV5311550.1 hypothetical protein [Chromatium okenii]
MLNLTPYAITIFAEDGNSSVTILPSSTVAKVETIERVVGSIDIEGIKVPIVKAIFGDVTGLDFQDDEPVIVSSMVLERLEGFADIYAPDTGDTAIRDDDGLLMGVTRLKMA